MGDGKLLPLSAISNFRMPSEEEIQAGCQRKYDAVSFTYLDHWSPGLHALSIPSQAVPLSDGEIHDLLAIHDGNGITDRLRALAARLDDAMDWAEHFVRLNSRSPKDAAYPGLPITCAGRQALAWIMGSERTFDDLCLLRRTGPAFIYLRKWVHIPKAHEFRCFIKDGEMIAATQYHKDEPFTGWRGAEEPARVWDALRRFYADTVKPHVPRGTFVLDVFPEPGGLRVLEINPYGLSDPILFDGGYAQIEAEGGLRVPAPVGASSREDDDDPPDDDSPVGPAETLEVPSASRGGEG